MFEEFIKDPRWLKRHREAPMTAERELYLRHLVDEGRGLGTLRQIISEMRHAAELLDLKKGQFVTLDDLYAVAERWLHDSCTPHRDRKRRSHVKMKTLFVGHIRDWLRFVGCFKDEHQTGPFDSIIDEYIESNKIERGLAKPTLMHYRKTAQYFFCWCESRIGQDLSQLNANHLSAYVQDAPFSGWSRASIAAQIGNLRVLIRWLGDRGLCSPKLSDCVRAPRLYTHERYPLGPTWSQVQQVVNSACTTSVQDLRDRAILLLLSVYGFRSGEVCRLRLDDIDWDNETIRVVRSKQRKTGIYPLTSTVGEAIIAYLEVRPTCRHRTVFLSLRQPFRPLCRMGNVVRNRQRRLGQELKRYGPHGLRHACATYLLSEGFTLKQISDHLGHTMIRATEAYAKVDVVSLRKVGELAMPELIACNSECAGRETPFYDLGHIDGLRTVANISLKGVL